MTDQEIVGEFLEAVDGVTPYFNEDDEREEVEPSTFYLLFCLVFFLCLPVFDFITWIIRWLQTRKR